MSKKIQLNIGSRLGDLRKRKKMTLDELSSKSGVSKSIISQIERNIPILGWDFGAGNSVGQHCQCHRYSKN